ncbi:hypothetical protein [Megasphaera massiliensis]|uniref:hypothetical protein n=1 Tax=Megasphaera massiliensis TaxID=1232428 RepID=UPI0020463D84|nr:hypothetical protein [uncultured Megasphaera sp.]DAL49095.1 MAG TPA_asm: UBA-like domain protein [Caudoviricetes sp.]
MNGTQNHIELLKKLGYDEAEIPQILHREMQCGMTADMSSILDPDDDEPDLWWNEEA